MELTIEDLACRRGGRTVFAGLSWQARAGQVVAVRGPNGAGKSSLLRVLAGLVPAAAGAVRLGEATLADRAAFQEHVAYAGHLDAIKPALTVGQNLGVWAAVFGTAPARVAGALDHFGLQGLEDRPAAQCSAGQKRRLGLARLMLVDRPLWLLDEPTVSLDTAATARVADLVRGHAAGGGIALIATHIDLGIADMAELRLDPEATGVTSAGRGQGQARPPAEDAFLDGDWR